MASGADIDDVVTMLFDVDAFGVDEVNDDVEFDIVDATPEPMVLPPDAICLHATVDCVVSSVLFAVDMAN